MFSLIFKHYINLDIQNVHKFYAFIFCVFLKIRNTILACRVCRTSMFPALFLYSLINLSMSDCYCYIFVLLCRCFFLLPKK